MRNPDDRALAFECLRLANDPGRTPGEVVERATDFFEFVTEDESAKALRTVRAVVGG